MRKLIALAALLGALRVSACPPPVADITVTVIDDLYVRVDWTAPRTVHVAWWYWIDRWDGVEWETIAGFEPSLQSHCWDVPPWGPWLEYRVRVVYRNCEAVELWGNAGDAQ